MRIFFCALINTLLYTPLLYAQMTLEQKMENIDSVMVEHTGEAAVLVLDSLTKNFIIEKDWESAAICRRDKAVKLRKNSKNALLFLYADTTAFIFNSLPENHELQASFLVECGFHHFQLKEFKRALYCYEKALIIYDDLEIVNKFTIYTYRKAGGLAMRLVDYEKSDAYYTAVLNKDTSGRYHPEAYFFLAQSANYQRQFSKAIQYYEKGAFVAEKEKDIFRNNCQGAIAYASRNQGQKALDLLADNLKLFQSGGAKFKERYLGSYYYNCTEVYLALKKRDKATASIKESIAIKREEPDRGEKNRELAKLYVELGDLYFENEDYEKALQTFHLAVIKIFPNFNNPDLLSNPSIKELSSESFMMTSAKRKAKTYLKRYQKDHNTQWLKPAENCFDLVFAGAEKLRQTFVGDEAKFYLELFNANSLEQAIYTSFLLYEQNKNEEHLKKAYNFSEQHKSLVLREAILKNKTYQSEGVPDSIVEKEAMLREKILKLKMQVQQETNTKNSLEKKLNGVENEYNLLFTGIKIKYPFFAKNIQQNIHRSLSEIQSKLLDDRTILLQFHWGEESVFLFKVDKSELGLSKFKRIDLDEKLMPFLRLLSSSNAQMNNPAQWFLTSNQLCQYLMRDVLSNLNPKIDKIIIVPDGAISSIPFGALTTSRWEGNFNDAPYLLKRFHFQYAYSPALILQTPLSNEKLSGALTVAPIFENQQRGLSTLRNSEKEIDQIQQPNLTALKKEKATLPAFQKNIKNKQIIHLSTHAKSNEGKLPPRIEFADTCLYLPQLYTMQIPAELIVLSTCESNLGTYEKGEGVMSLSRGFAYAGAESMIASLWAVNEKSTSTLFGDFYTHLDHHSKSDALRASKLQYLQNPKIQDRLKAPYYWAGFVFIGKDGMIENNVGFNRLFYAGLVGFIGLFVYFSVLNKNRHN